MAGLLTFSFPGAFPFRQTWNSGVVTETIPEITAAGTVQDSHLVPYYPELQQ
jgi:hypothetical protein